MLQAVDDLVPLRALNQVTYCPRLYYLEYVESLMQVNEHVADGTFQHRRVNDPELAGRSRQEKDALHTRSVSMDSPRLGITGKLDLVEEKNGECYPVEYKRGGGPADGGFWDNDAAQVCGQALLLEESLGRKIDKGVLYYQASKRRVEVPLDDELRAKTLAAIELIARVVRTGHAAAAAGRGIAASLPRLLAADGLPAGRDAVPAAAS